ncbi:DeoR family transcriptional regulator of aga operon [Catenulispora sp. GAS73]|uniref:DeoR/GlpR family DNA-binding transcription regulator n=1 Tax=Catenulispora sp. GAS73 TaxID=3156269 RepID=UPI0035122D8A
MRTPNADTAPHNLGHKRCERMRRLLALLAACSPGDAPLTLDELVAELGVSKATLRRDLAQLEDAHTVVRTHGGVRAGVDGVSEVPLRLRTQASLAKRAIAQAAAQLIPCGAPHTLAVCGGTTATEVVRALRRRRELTLITNALPIAAEAAAWSDMRVVIAGGLVRAHSLEAVGPLSEAAFNSFTFATAILGADGVSSEHGVTTQNEIEARTNHAMVRHARRVIVVADATKIGRVTRAQLAHMAEVHDLVTDAQADAEELSLIRAAGVHVHVAC